MTTGYYQYEGKPEPKKLPPRLLLQRRIQECKERISLYGYWASQGKEMAKIPARQARKELKQLQALWQSEMGKGSYSKIEEVHQERQSYMTFAEIMNRSSMFEISSPPHLCLRGSCMNERMSGSHLCEECSKREE